MRVVAALVVFGVSLPAACFASAGFFSVENREGVWWLVDPAGKRFLSIGMDMVNHGAKPNDLAADNPQYCAMKSYSTAKAWEDDTLKRLPRWGFNTIGAWADESLVRRGEMPFTVCLHLGASASIPWTDMWSPSLRETIMKWGKEWTGKWKDDPMMIGYFADNEMPWWDETLFSFHLAQPWRTRVEKDGHERWVENLTKLRLVKLLEREYGSSLERLREDWVIPEFMETKEKSAGAEKVVKRERQEIRSFGDLRKAVVLKRRLGRQRPRVLDAFMADLYDRYGELMYRALKEADPNHLLLGERHYGYLVPAQIYAAGKWLDLLSINRSAWVLDGWISPNHMATITALSGRPVLVGEYYFCANENRSGNRNSSANFPTVETQRDRELGYAAQVRQMAGMSNMVGWHWFQYFDEPTHGRGDGEDYNMGIVDINNRAYEGMVRASVEVNGEADGLHARSRPVRAHVAGVAPEFVVPESGAIELDGDLRDWDKVASWLPGVGGQPGGAVLGDFFVSASRGYLHVAMTYQKPYRDATTAEELGKGEPWPVSECERLSISLADEREKTRTMAWSLCPDEEAGWVLVSDSGGDPVKWNRKGATFEASIPVAGAEKLRLGAMVRSWGDSQVMYWSAYALDENPAASGWGRLTLPK